MRTERDSIDHDEIRHFARDSAHWWDENGPFRPLHRLNPVRIGYIKQQICRHFDRDELSLTPFKGLRILDVGCGGGLTCEPLARLGADVTGVDADNQAVEIALGHAAKTGLNIRYLNTGAENIEEQFDIVLGLEVIEHVTEPETFIATCAHLCRPGGLAIVSTINRTGRSFALGIVTAEYILGWVPKGTHNWRKFVKPSELSRFARQAGLDPTDITGLMLNPLKNQFQLSKTDLAVNYFMTAEKPL